MLHFQKAAGTLAVMAIVTSTAISSGAAKAAGKGDADDAAGVTLEEILVTAEKRSEDVQRAPAQITVVTGDLIVEQGATNIQALGAFAPNLQLSSEASNTQVFIRGIGQNFDAASDDPGSAIYIDQVYTPRQATTGSLFDVERMEVLPGPQGTLYGRNAAGGALNILTRKPGDTFGGEIMLEGGNYSDVHGFAALNIPVNSILKLRGAVDVHRHDGYLSSGQDDLNAKGGRLSVLVTPSDNLSILLRGEFTHNNSNGDGVVDQPAINPSNPWYAPVATGSDYYSRRSISKINGELNYNLSQYTLTYIPSYTYFSVHDKEPLGSPVNYFPDPNNPGALTGFYANLERVGDHQKQITNELRLSTDQQRYHWVAGLYQLKADTYTGGALFQIPGGPGPYFILSNDGPYSVHSKSYALFGEGTYSITDKARLTLGGRYSDDRKSGDGAPSFFIASAPTCPPSCATPFTSDNKWTKVDWKVGMQYDVAPQSMLYASVQTGYIEGGFSTVPAAATTNAFAPEKLIAYTAGTKNRFFNNRVQLNDEVFYYDYRDLQVNAVDLTTGVSVFYNAPKSRIYGNELDLKVLATSTTELGINIGLLRARFVKAMLPPATVYTCGPGIPAGVPCSVNNGPATPASVDYSGTDLSNSPPVSGTAYIAQTINLSGGANIQGRVSSHYEAASWALYSHLQGLRKEAYSKTDVTLTYNAANGGVYVALWAKNLENHGNFVTHATSNVYGLAPAYIEPPRTYGARIGRKF